MTELSHAARAAIEAGRTGLAAPLGAKEALQAKILAAASAGASAASAAAAPTSTAAAPTAAVAPTAAAAAPTAAAVPLAAKVVVVTALLAGGGVSAHFVLRDRPAATSSVPAQVTAPPAAHATTRAQTSAPIVEPIVEPAPALEPAKPHHPVARVAAPKRSAGGLAEELRLVRTARRALAAGNPHGALTAIAGYERRFPKGELAPEVALVRIDALCAAGRTDDAEVEIEQFVSRWPKSPHRRRALRGCSAEKEAQP